MSSFEHDEALYRMTSSVRRSYSRCISRLPTESAATDKPATGSVAVSSVARKRPTEWPTQFGAAMADADPLPTESADYSQASNEKNRRCKYCALNLIPETAVRVLRRCQEIRPAAATPRTSDRTQLQAHGMSTLTVSQTRKTSEYELHFYVAFLRKQSLRGCKAYRDLEHLEAVQEIIFEVCASETDMTSNDPTNGCITDSIRPTKPADINVLKSDVHLANDEKCFPSSFQRDVILERSPLSSSRT